MICESRMRFSTASAAGALLLITFLAACGGGSEPGPLITTASGLQYQVLEEGKGDTVKARDTVWVHYTLWLEDGTVVDSSLEAFGGRGEPFQTQIGVGAVIAGWDEGIVGMKVGERRKLIIPPELAYGERGAGSSVPPNATLVFETELVRKR